DDRMKTQSADRTGILIVHLWIEANATDGFRARITQTLDSTDPEQAMVTAANPEDIYAVVRTWVEAFVTGIEQPPRWRGEEPGQLDLTW
ncbi:MAG: hypothetical protein ACXVQY_05175, partial [Actinomycetota bacterium]